jgi:hypothetical protein
MGCFFLACPSSLLNDIQAAALYAQASDFNKTARFYYMKAEDAYFLANAQASETQYLPSFARIWIPFHGLCRCLLLLFFCLKPAPNYVGPRMLSYVFNCCYLAMIS